ncbi:MAG: Verru_Chthon cassette protein A, partial [Verrucomicrobiota bacterium]
MKIPEKLSLSKAVSKDKKGVALVTILTVMALTTILVLSFFSLATSEHRSSFTYSNGLQAQQVAEQAVNMVIAQIREATVNSSNVTSLATKTAWASQPGAIRTWDIQGQLKFIYKLYSSNEMKSEDANAVGFDYGLIQNWSSNPDRFVDLNEPVIRGEKVYYPIVHPLAADLPTYDPLDGDGTGVEGFSYTGDVAQGEFGAEAAEVAGASRGHLAMPVEWLYQLADGTLGYLSDSGSESSGYEFVPISGDVKPTEDNQIVARFGFWADDETSKLNLNTHAGGLAWDIPKAGGEVDMNMGRYQPAQKEWQRYPGHPASTHLGPALAPGIVDIVNDRDAMEMLYGVTPRVVGGGSESGTRLINTRDPAEMNGLVADTEPLFPSLDDMIMRSDRKPHEFPSPSGTPIPDDELSEYLERSKFFITVYSRAPEVNMFNLPRVAIWPIYNAEVQTSPISDYQTKLTPFDRLIHYCSTVGGRTDSLQSGGFDYIFRRERAD